VKPRSLVWQLLAVVLITLALSELSAAFLLRTFVTSPTRSIGSRHSSAI